MEKGFAVSGMVEDGGSLLDSNLEELYGLQSFVRQPVTIGERVVPLEPLQDNTGVDVDQGMVVVHSLGGGLEAVGVILDGLDCLEQTLELASLIGPGGPG